MQPEPVHFEERGSGLRQKTVQLCFVSGVLHHQASLNIGLLRDRLLALSHIEPPVNARMVGSDPLLPVGRCKLALLSRRV